MAKVTKLSNTNPFTDLIEFDNESASSKRKSPDIKNRDAILAVLAELGKLNVTDDDLIFQGTKFILPAQMEGNIKGAARYLLNYEEQQNSPFEFSRTFRFRPDDVAHAFQSAMMKMFGTAGIGKSTFSFFFGEQKPQMRSIDIGVGQTTQVPYGRVALEPLQAMFTVGGTRDAEFGVLGHIAVEAPRKYRAHIEAFFTLIEAELKDNSIYKGKAINGAESPGFVDVSQIDPDRIVYSQEALDQLDANLWTLIDHADTMRELKISLKRAVLCAGSYGTGKTLCGGLTAQKAVRAGWTFVLCRPGKDDLFEVLRTAQLYAPAVVWFEDIDVVAEGGGDGHIAKLLDALDGITAKGVDIIAGFTTNHIDKIHRGVLRPGRIDAVIPIEGWDAAGYIKLIRSQIKPDMLGDIDWDAVVAAYDGYLPAFAVEATSRAMRYVVARNGGLPGIIETQDLVKAAEGLRPQWQLMQDAGEGKKDTTIEELVVAAVEDVLGRTKLEDWNEPFSIEEKNPVLNGSK